MQLAEGIEEFLAYLLVELNRSPKTVSGYRKDYRVLQRFLEERGETTLERITPEVLGEYLVYLGKDLHYQANTLRRHVASLKSLFGFLTEAGYIAANPAANLVRPRIPRRQPRYLTREEVERLFQSVPGEGSFTALRDQTILMTMYYAGARVEEVVNIRIGDIDFAEGFLCLRKGKGESRGGCPCTRNWESR